MIEKSYKFGKITLSQQALIIFVLGISMFITTLIILRGSKTGMAIALGYLVSTFYTTYMVNCLIVGQCKELAWFLVALISLSVLITVGSAVKLRGKFA